jgi:hypothetical protein
MNNFVNTASVETSRFLVLFNLYNEIKRFDYKKHIAYACVS